MGGRKGSLEGLVNMDLNFFDDKTVFITGHTGFKGSWLCKVLERTKAKVIGYSLNPPTEPNLFDLANISNNIVHIIGDIRDFSKLYQTIKFYKPDIILHLAAQPIVRDSYKDPKYTYETNVMGTVNILESIRQNKCVKSFLNVTTDKVYLNKEWCWGYRENEPLDGFDPYSNSKSCSELVTHSYYNSFFSSDDSISISTARAGNVIGGGDFSNDRIIPDCVRAQKRKEDILVRNPYSTRPYQHVLEPVMAYLLLVEKQYNNKSKEGWYNIGPDDCDCVSTGDLVDLFCKSWGNGANWVQVKESKAPHEANFLKLDSTKFKNTFNWHPRWHIEEAVDKVCEWSKAWLSGKDLSSVMNSQIDDFLKEK